MHDNLAQFKSISDNPDTKLYLFRRQTKTSQFSVTPGSSHTHWQPCYGHWSARSDDHLGEDDGDELSLSAASLPYLSITPLLNNNVKTFYLARGGRYCPAHRLGKRQDLFTFLPMQTKPRPTIVRLH